MTTLNEMIAVMQAAAEGKDIECSGKYLKEKLWRKTSNPAWNWSSYDYRVKPQPREFTVAYREDTGQIVGLSTGKHFIEVNPDNVKLGMIKTMRVREVLDNE